MMVNVVVGGGSISLMSKCSAATIARSATMVLASLCHHRSCVMSFDNSSGNAHQQSEQTPTTSSSSTASSSAESAQVVSSLISSNRSRRDPSAASTARRRLFQEDAAVPSSSSDSQISESNLKFCQRELSRDIRDKSQHYSFDFELGQPIQGGQYQWECVTSTAQQPESSSQPASEPAAKCQEYLSQPSASRQTSLFDLMPVRCRQQSSQTTTTSSYTSVKRSFSSKSSAPRDQSSSSEEESTGKTVKRIKLAIQEKEEEEVEEKSQSSSSSTTSSTELLVTDTFDKSL